MSLRIVPLTGDEIDSAQQVRMASFLEPNCYSLAIAMHRDLGWPMVGLKNGDTIWHAGAKTPDGHYFDARGPLDEITFKEAFAQYGELELVAVTEDQLKEIKPIPERLIESASRAAQAIWPHFPWKENTLHARVLQFALELEELSRKHGFWIRAPYETAPPIISETADDEAGYDIGILAVGGHTIKRRLKN